MARSHICGIERATKGYITVALGLQALLNSESAAVSLWLWVEEADPGAGKKQPKRKFTCKNYLMNVVRLTAATQSFGEITLLWKQLSPEGIGAPVEKGPKAFSKSQERSVLSTKGEAEKGAGRRNTKLTWFYWREIKALPEVMSQTGFLSSCTVISFTVLPLLSPAFTQWRIRNSWLDGFLFRFYWQLCRFLSSEAPFLAAVKLLLLPRGWLFLNKGLGCSPLKLSFGCVERAPQNICF